MLSYEQAKIGNRIYHASCDIEEQIKNDAYDYHKHHNYNYRKSDPVKFWELRKLGISDFTARLLAS